MRIVIKDENGIEQDRSLELYNWEECKEFLNMMLPTMFINWTATLIP